ncbi:MAG: MarC family protein [Geothermobacteraceae bacterium]
MSVETLLHALTSYFVIVDPLGTAVIFQALTGDQDRAWALRMAVRATVISVIIVLVFGFFGQSLLANLGISIESLRVAGGLLLFYTAFGMITRPRQPAEKAGMKVDISVYPLSIPLIAGPGCLTLTILLFSQRQDAGQTAALIVAVVLIYLGTLACLLAARSINRLLGETGDDILRRLLGVILAALAVQFIADGIRGLAG